MKSITRAKKHSLAIKTWICSSLFLSFISSYSHAKIQSSSYSDDTLVIKVKTYRKTKKNLYIGFSSSDLIYEIIHENAEEKVLAKLYFFSCSRRLYPNANIFDHLFQSRMMRRGKARCNSLNEDKKKQIESLKQAFQKHRELYLKYETLRAEAKALVDQAQLLEDFKESLEEQIYQIEGALEAFNEIENTIENVNDLNELDDLKEDVFFVLNKINSLMELSDNQENIALLKESELSISDISIDINNISVDSSKESIHFLITEIKDELRSQKSDIQEKEIKSLETKLKENYKKQDEKTDEYYDLKLKVSNLWEDFLGKLYSDEEEEIIKKTAGYFRVFLPPVDFEYSIHYK